MNLKVTLLRTIHVGFIISAIGTSANGACATEINAQVLSGQMEDPTLWLVDIRSDEEKSTGVLDVAFSSDTDPDSLWIPARLKRLVLIASMPVPNNTQTAWQQFAEQRQIQLYWLTGLPDEWQRAGFILVFPHSEDINSTTELPQQFIIPRGLCELADPAMVIDLDTINPEN